MEQPAPIKPTTIAMADDHTMLRNALAQFIEGFGNYRVVIKAANGCELMDKLKEIKCPDLLLLDINMPEMNGIETAKQVSRQYPGIKIIALSMMEDELMIVCMVKNGARGFLLKDAEPEHFKEVMDNVLKTGYHFSEEISGDNLYSLHRDNETPKKKDLELSEAETHFCSLACTEMTYTEIAGKMGVSPRTVDGYRDSLFEKLGLKTRVGLALYAVREGMVDFNYF
jgi:DNA-binding NarL/FixJ family response regulator